MAHAVHFLASAFGACSIRGSRALGGHLPQVRLLSSAAQPHADVVDVSYRQLRSALATQAQGRAGEQAYVTDSQSARSREQDISKRALAHSVLVDFYSDGCAPCKAMKPHLLEVAAHYGPTALTLATVNGDNCEPEQLEEIDIVAYPTVVLFQGGVEKTRFIGAKSAPQIKAHLKQSNIEI